MSKSPEELYAEREKRINDAIALKPTDRVPVAPMFEFFPAFYMGMTPQEVMYDLEKTRLAWKKTMLDFDPDMFLNPILAYPGPALEALDYKLLQWPGHGISPQRMYQFVEGEYMKAEEYDAFLDDPSDFMFRIYFPRICGALEPFKKTVPLHNAIWLGLFSYVAPFGEPGIARALSSLIKAGQEFTKWYGFLGEFDAEMKELGYPSMAGSATFAPFDAIGDTLRGTKGIMLDMYRRPEKLLKAIEKVTPWMLEMGVSGAKLTGNPKVWFFLHKGADGFMSPEQFKTFYWPSLKEVILGLIKEDLIPCVYIEGDFTSRLEDIADVPKGKVLYHFEKVDIYKAKEILGGIACISGNVPNTLLYTGTPEEVKEYCKKLIDVLGKDGGFIMDSAAVIDEARPENIKAMIDFTKEYGVYR